MHVSTGSPSQLTVDQEQHHLVNYHTTPALQPPMSFLMMLKKIIMILKLHTWVMIRTSAFQFQKFLLINLHQTLFIKLCIPITCYLEHTSKWTKDHPLENIIGALDRPVSTRLQLHEQALFCYYDAFLTSVEPKNYKEALTQAVGLSYGKRKLHEFERLEVWELVPPPDKAFVISLKWIYKVKLDELGGLLIIGSVVARGIVKKRVLILRVIRSGCQGLEGSFEFFLHLCSH
ncbi:hypothetical protein Tco_0480706 [Tanacetum coccineum]